MPIQRQSNVRFDKWNELRFAFEELIRTGHYESLVSHHNPFHRMHGSRSDDVGYQRFLPWHRAYLIVLERALRRIDASLSIPYWDWNVDAGRLKGFGNFMGLSFGRTLRTLPSEIPATDSENWFTSEEEIESLTSHSDSYDDFTRSLEDGPHNDGHNWIGGDMASMKSPRDPAFWFHHAQVDRIWSIWQKNNQGKMANLSGDEADLDPWETEFSIQSVNDISQLGSDGYEYV